MDIQSITNDLASSPTLKDAADRAGIDPAQGGAIVQGVLEHAGAGGGPESLAQGIAAKTGLDAGQIQQFLPNVMAVLQSHPAAATEGEGGLAGVIVALRSSSIGGLLSEGEGRSFVQDAKDMFGRLLGGGKPH